MKYEVIVIGSGPAGCAAAISCAMLGVNVLMIAGKKQNISAEEINKQAVESIHPGVRSLLQTLKAEHCINASVQGTYSGIISNGRYNNLGEDDLGKWTGYHINRVLFDNALLAHAATQKISVIYDDKVKDVICDGERIIGIITGKGENINCQYLVDASGHKCVAGRKFFKRKFHSSPLTTWTGVSEDIPSTHFIFEKSYAHFTSHESGWTWIASTGSGRCTWTRLETKGKQDFSPPKILAQYPVVGKPKVSNRRWYVFRPVCKEGLLLCGDAAGIIDPASGQGILHALHGGVMTARTILNCIRQPAFEALYLAKYDSWFIDDYMKKIMQLKKFYEQAGTMIF